jgi:hypothetical protein
MRNQPEPIAGHLDHHDDYNGDYYRNNRTAHGSADRKRDQPNRRQLIHATSDSATGTD